MRKEFKGFIKRQIILFIIFAVTFLIVYLRNKKEISVFYFYQMLVLKYLIESSKWSVF